ncbi:hypothetical protein [Streptomyces sp. NPDC001828]|uniref:hypothetical protein n=1 Tax=Streptomyces sp. NPDC001828 TaxID=3364615 RepID=UPI0036AC640D
MARGLASTPTPWAALLRAKTTAALSRMVAPAVTTRRAWRVAGGRVRAGAWARATSESDPIVDPALGQSNAGKAMLEPDLQMSR